MQETHHFRGIKQDGIQFHLACWSVSLSSVTSAVYQQFLNQRMPSSQFPPQLSCVFIIYWTCGTHSKISIPDTDTWYTHWWSARPVWLLVTHLAHPWNENNKPLCITVKASTAVAFIYIYTHTSTKFLKNESESNSVLLIFHTGCRAVLWRNEMTNEKYIEEDIETFFIIIIFILRPNVRN